MYCTVSQSVSGKCQQGASFLESWTVRHSPGELFLAPHLLLPSSVGRQDGVLTS